MFIDPRAYRALARVVADPRSQVVRVTRCKGG